MERERLERDGFCVLRGLVDPAELVELARELARYRAHVLPTLSEGAAFYLDPARPETCVRLCDPQEHDDWFARFLREGPLARAAIELLGEDVRLFNAQWFDKPVGAPATPPHQDNAYIGIEPPRAVSVWLALADVDEGNGCLRYVRGSHAAGSVAHADGETLGFSRGIDASALGAADEVAVPARRGDLVVHHVLTVHRTDPNASGRPRPALGAVYRAAGTRVDAAAYRGRRARAVARLSREGRLG